MVFFYKQKAADELRISYWSSDLCSSDLPSAGAPKRTRSAGVRSNEAGIPGREGDSGGDRTPARTASSGSPGCYDHRNRCRLESLGTDRKSVGEGTSVEVRVDSGGRRMIIKITRND